MTLTAEQKEMRRGRMTGSRIAGALGLSPWKGPLATWMEITGRDEVEESLAMKLGTRLEPVVCDLYAEETGCVISIHGTVQVDDWLAGTPDRICSPSLATPPTHGLEAKTSGWSGAPIWRLMQRWGEPGTDHVPPEYHCQATTYMHLFGLERWDVAVLWPGEGLRIYRIDRDPTHEANLLGMARDWWRKYVLADTPPPADASQSATDALNKLWTHGEGVIEATEEDAALAQEWAEVRGEKDFLERRERELGNRMRERIGAAGGDCLVGSGFRVRYKRNKDSVKTDWAAVAIAAGASPEDVKRHTTTSQGARPLVPTGPVFEAEKERT